MSFKEQICVAAVLAVFSTVPAFAQFSGAVAGVVADPVGAVIQHASITIVNLSTQATKSTVTDKSGTYTFVSLAPGSYRLDVTQQGFAKSSLDIVLNTGQTLNVPIVLKLASASQTVQVTAQAPLLDTAETRNQLTLNTQTISTLPLTGRNMISLMTFAPGVVGLGTENVGNGTGVDNFSTETQVDASANGQGAVANMYIVDGLDVSSNAREGVLNLTPNPDTIQEMSIQTNSFNVDYGRTSSTQMAMTTKSGTDRYHGNVSDYYTTQQLWTRTEFTPTTGYAPFHSNNMSATIGGPIIPHHQMFFFFGFEGMRELSTTGNQLYSFEDPAFTTWAQQNFPNTLGTEVLTKYPASNATQTNVIETAAEAFPGTCGTPATFNIPCTLPVQDSGLFNSAFSRNGNQYFVRADKEFSKDRFYGSLYKTTTNNGNPSIRPAFASDNPLWQYALQFNEAHNFSSSMLNEAAFGLSKVRGITSQNATFSVPDINVSGDGTGFGIGFATGEYSQHNYHWRDVLTKVRGEHTIKVGYEGWTGDYEQSLTGVHDTPFFAFNSLLDLVQDNVYLENGLAYNPLTGEKSPYPWDMGQIAHGVFAEDSWRVKKNLTFNYGLRFDDFGNPYARNSLTVVAPFFFGSGQAIDQQVANGSMIQRHYALNRAINNIFSPRVGIAWDPTGRGEWVLRGGMGIYHNAPSLGVWQGAQGNPPGPIIPTFYGGQTPAPIFTLGNSNTPPFGFTYPTLSPQPLDSKGGIPGLNLGVASVNPNITTPLSYNFSTTLERQITGNMVASIGYTGVHGTRLLSAGGQTQSVEYGVDINAYPGDLIEHNSTVPTRLNTSFGNITYTTNDRESNYNALILAVRGRFARRGFITASYTRSASNDDDQIYPTWQNPTRWYGPSVWDVPNRLSLAWNYELPGFNKAHGFLGHVSGGWQISSTTILQSGYPYTVFTYNSFQPTYDSNGIINGILPTSGDYNADGDNYDFPNAVSYKTPKSRQDYLQGVFVGGSAPANANGYANFPLPQLGQEGNEKFDGFRGPGFADTDFALIKETALREGVSLQLRGEFFNLFNRPNLTGLDTALPDGTFGRATSQFNPRWVQVSANLKF